MGYDEKDDDPGVKRVDGEGCLMSIEVTVEREEDTKVLWVSGGGKELMGT